MSIGNENAETRVKKAIEKAAQLGWLRPHPTDGWVMCGAAVEKTILMALGASQFQIDEASPVITTEELCSLIMSSIWNREQKTERYRYRYSDPHIFKRERLKK